MPTHTEPLEDSPPSGDYLVVRINRALLRAFLLWIASATRVALTIIGAAAAVITVCGWVAGR